MSDILDRLRAFRDGAPSIPIDIPEWDIKAFVRPMSAAKHAAIRKGKSESRMAAEIIIAGLVDEKGKPLLPDNAESLAEIENQPSGLVARVMLQIMEHTNGEFDAKNS